MRFVEENQSCIFGLISLKSLAQLHARLYRRATTTWPLLILYLTQAPLRFPDS